MNDDKTIIPDEPKVRIKCIPTELEKIVNSGPYDGNINLIRRIVNKLSEPLWLMLDRSDDIQRPIFKIKEDNKEGNKLNEYNLERIYDTNEHNFNFYFEELMREVISTLIFTGKAYIKIQLTLDPNKTITQVTFQPIRAILIREDNGEFSFKSSSWNNEIINFTIEESFVVVLSLADIGLSEDFFAAAFDKIRKVPLITDFHQSFINPNPWLNINDVIHDRNIAILRATKDFYYDGPEVINSGLMSDFHLTYRICQYRIFQRKIFDYVVEKVNKKLSGLEKSYNFFGQIGINEPPLDYMKYYNKLTEGKITLKEIFDIFQYGENGIKK